VHGEVQAADDGDITPMADERQMSTQPASDSSTAASGHPRWAGGAGALRSSRGSGRAAGSKSRSGGGRAGVLPGAHEKHGREYRLQHLATGDICIHSATDLHPYVLCRWSPPLSKGILRKKNTSSGTNPPGVSLNRLELKKQMRYFFRAKIFCVLQKNVLGKFLA
jgi:hypothetical protein